MSRTGIARGLALALSTSAAAFSGLMLVGHALNPDEFSWDGVAVGLAALALMAATASAWLNARFSWAAHIVAAALFSLVIALTAGSNVLIVAVLLPAPWYLAGLLLLIGSSAGRGQSPKGSGPMLEGPRSR